MTLFLIDGGALVVWRHQDATSKEEVFDRLQVRGDTVFLRANIGSYSLSSWLGS